YFSTAAHSAADRPPGSVKRSQEAISGYIYLVAAEPGQLSPHDGVVLLEQLAPIPISQLHRSFRRANNVSEEDRRQDAIWFRAMADAGEKFFDLIEERRPYLPPKGYDPHRVARPISRT